MAWWHTEWWHNLAFRPDKPALGYGARRAPRCGSRHALSASQVLEWAYPRKFYRAERFAHHDQRSLSSARGTPVNTTLIGLAFATRARIAFPRAMDDGPAWSALQLERAN
jgi:hypothetical protein